MIEVVNLERAFGRFHEHWSPRIAADVNDAQVKLVKLQGEFVWHQHEREDELFLVVRGEMRMRLREGDRIVRPGEFIVIPRGTEHCPVADEETWVVLVEPRGTLNTGDAEDPRTVADPERLT